MFSDSGVHLELHYSLIEDKIVGSAADILRSAWENASPVSDTSEYVFGDDLFFFYHTAHMAKHFVNGGCGIRPFIDIWVLNHCVSFDREERDALLAKGGLLAFAEQAEALSEAWFGNGEHTDITRRMQDYLLKGGVYGTTANRVSVQQIRKGGKLRYAFSRIWLPYDELLGLPVEQAADEADTRLTFLSTVKREVSRILSVGVVLAACVCYLMGTISTDSTIVAFGFSAVVFCFDTMIREK